MKVFQSVGPGIGEITVEPIPDIRDDEVLVKVYYCGICGTDYDLFSGNSSFFETNQATYPIRQGHEWSGVVARTGALVTKIKVGDRVVGDNFVSCGVCEACRNGDLNHCTGRHHVGTINPCWPGAFAEYYKVPERHVYKIAKHVSLKEAALCEPLSVAYGGIKKMDIKQNSIVVVIGTGSIALSAMALALYRGARVYVVGRTDGKLEIARRMGATGTINNRHADPVEELQKATGGLLADFVLECSGVPGNINEGIRLSAQKATIAMIGFYSVPRIEADFNSLVTKEITMIGIMGEYGNLEAVKKIMEKADLKVHEMITDVVPFKDCIQAFSPQNPHSVVKTMVEITREKE